MGDVETIIKNNIIVVFSSSSCPYCREAINALRGSLIIVVFKNVFLLIISRQGTGKAFEVIEATSAQRDILLQKTGSSSVPNIWVKGKYVGGCNDGPGDTSLPNR